MVNVPLPIKPRPLVFSIKPRPLVFSIKPRPLVAPPHGGAIA
jgi:hypothetical protein